MSQFMLLANMTAASVIVNGLLDQALLRRHEAPLERRLVSPIHPLLVRESNYQNGFVKRAMKLGYTMDASSSSTLQKSFDAVEDRDAALCLELLKRKSMQRYAKGATRAGI